MHGIAIACIGEKVIALSLNCIPDFGDYLDLLSQGQHKDKRSGEKFR